ncbi:amidase family protein [Geodermatophilus sp. URMC 65]
MALDPCPSRRSVTVTAAMAGLLLVLSGTVAVPSSGADPAPETTGPAVVAPSLGGLDLDAATIPEIQARIDAGTFTAVELTRAYLARIVELDDVLGSVLFVNPNAVAEAAASDQVRRESGVRGPLEGIPVLLKDNVDTADIADHSRLSCPAREPT